MCHSAACSVCIVAVNLARSIVALSSREYWYIYAVVHWSRKFFMDGLN
jgi:hypothetical protein